MEHPKHMGKNETINILAEIYNDYINTDEYNNVMELMEILKNKVGKDWNIFYNIFLTMKYTIKEYAYKYTLPIRYIISTLERAKDILYIIYLDNVGERLTGYIPPKYKDCDYIDNFLYTYTSKNISNIKITANYGGYKAKSNIKNNTEDNIIYNIHNDYNINIVNDFYNSLDGTSYNIMIDKYKHCKSVKYIAFKYKISISDVNNIITETKEKIKKLLPKFEK